MLQRRPKSLIRLRVLGVIGMLSLMHCAEWPLTRRAQAVLDHLRPAVGTVARTDDQFMQRALPGINMP